ncbi:unnamed protein product, partial [Hapterophycus canaliculatus]
VRGLWTCSGRSTRISSFGDDGECDASVGCCCSCLPVPPSLASRKAFLKRSSLACMRLNQTAFRVAGRRGRGGGGTNLFISVAPFGRDDVRGERYAASRKCRRDGMRPRSAITVLYHMLARPAR